MKVTFPSRRGWIFTAAVSVFQTEHPHESWWNHIPGFFAGYGFLGCAAIVLISKWLGRRYLQKREDFYDG